MSVEVVHIAVCRDNNVIRLIDCGEEALEKKYFITKEPIVSNEQVTSKRKLGVDVSLSWRLRERITIQ